MSEDRDCDTCALCNNGCPECDAGRLENWTPKPKPYYCPECGEELVAYQGPPRYWRCDKTAHSANYTQEFIEANPARFQKREPPPMMCLTCKHHLVGLEACRRRKKRTLYDCLEREIGEPDKTCYDCAHCPGDGGGESCSQPEGALGSYIWLFSDGSTWHGIAASGCPSFTPKPAGIEGEMTFVGNIDRLGEPWWQTAKEPSMRMFLAVVWELDEKKQRVSAVTLEDDMTVVPIVASSARRAEQKVLQQYGKDWNMEAVEIVVTELGG